MVLAVLQADELSAGGSGTKPMFQLATPPTSSYRFRMHMFILKVKFNLNCHQKCQTFISDLINDVKLPLFASLYVKEFSKCSTFVSLSSEQCKGGLLY